MNKKKILITGGAGFVGSYVNVLLHRNGFETVVIDNLQSGSADMVVAGELIQQDLRDKKALSSLFSTHQFDAVMHFAASIDAGESVRDPLQYYDNNVYSTICLLQAMQEHNVKKIIFSSTAAVYGEPQAEIITESHPLSPINPYGQSKKICETIIKDAELAYGIQWMALRYFNAAGADPKSQVKNQKLDEHNLIPICLRSLIEKKSITIFGIDYPTKDGTCIRDYIHIHDLGCAHLAALQALFSGKPSSIYNLGNGQGYTVRDVVDAVREVTKSPVEIIEGKRRKGDPVQLIANATKASQELQWKPEYPNLHAIVDHAWRALH